MGERGGGGEEFTLIFFNRIGWDCLTTLPYLPLPTPGTLPTVILFVFVSCPFLFLNLGDASIA